MVNKVKIKNGIVYIADDIKIKEDTIYVDGFPTMTIDRLRIVGRQMKRSFESRERNTELRNRLKERGLLSGNDERD